MKDPVVIVADTRCNNACRFCEVASPRVPARVERSEEEVAGLLQQASHRDIVVTGGEPTMRTRLPEWLARFGSDGPRRVILRTNGRMLAYREFAERLVAAGVQRFEVALHGPSAEIHDWLTRTEGSFKQAVGGLRHVARLGCETAVNTVLTRSNYRHLGDMVPLLARIGVSRWVLHELRRLGSAVENEPQLAAPWPMIEAHVRHAAKRVGRHSIALQVVRATSTQDAAA